MGSRCGTDCLPATSLGHWDVGDRSPACAPARPLCRRGRFRPTRSSGMRRDLRPKREWSSPRRCRLLSMTCSALPRARVRGKKAPVGEDRGLLFLRSTRACRRRVAGTHRLPTLWQDSGCDCERPNDSIPRCGTRCGVESRPDCGAVPRLVIVLGAHAGTSLVSPVIGRTTGAHRRRVAVRPRQMPRSRLTKGPGVRALVGHM